MTTLYPAGEAKPAFQTPGLRGVLAKLHAEWGGSQSAQARQIERSVERIQAVTSHIRTHLDILDTACQMLDSDPDAALFHLRQFADHAEYSNTPNAEVAELIALTARVTGYIEALRDAETSAPGVRSGG